MKYRLMLFMAMRYASSKLGSLVGVALGDVVVGELLSAGGAGNLVGGKLVGVGSGLSLGDIPKVMVEGKPVSTGVAIKLAGGTLVGRLLEDAVEGKTMSAGNTPAETVVGYTDTHTNNPHTSQNIASWYLA